MSTRIRLSNGDNVDVETDVTEMGDQLAQAIRAQRPLGVRDSEGVERLLNTANIIELLDRPAADRLPPKPMD